MSPDRRPFPPRTAEEGGNSLRSHKAKAQTEAVILKENGKERLYLWGAWLMDGKPLNEIPEGPQKRRLVKSMKQLGLPGLLENPNASSS